MSKIELAIYIAIIIIPLLALVLSFPIRKKNKSKDAPKTVSLNEFDKSKGDSESAGLQIDNKADLQVKSNKPATDLADPAVLQDEDFRSYLNDKAKKMPRPSRLQSGGGEDFIRELEANVLKDEDKNQKFSTEWQSLSPEMKAIIISNIFERKF